MQSPNKNDDFIEAHQQAEDALNQDGSGIDYDTIGLNRCEHDWQFEESDKHKTWYQCTVCGKIDWD